MGNLKPILPIVLSLVIAVAGSTFLYRWIAVKTAPKQIVTMEKVDAVPVTVAKIDLPWGTRLTRDMIQTKPFLKESLPAGYFINPDEVVGRVVSTPLKSMDPVVQHRLAPSDAKLGGVSAVLRQGTRAVAVKGDKIIGISGFISPGNRVDVLVTITDPEKDREVSKTVLENILVLASGTQVEETENSGPSPVDVYTLEVTPDQAERLVLAATRGKLQFSLRNSIDTEAILTRGVTIPQLLNSLALAGTAPPKPAPATAHRAAPQHRVRQRLFIAENIRGLALTKEEFVLKETLHTAGKD